MARERLLGDVMMKDGVGRRRVIQMLGGLALLPAAACGSDDGDDAATATTTETTSSTTAETTGRVARGPSDCGDFALDGPEESAKVIEAAADALNRGDRDGLRAALAEDVEYQVISSTGQVLDARRGPDEVSPIMEDVEGEALTLRAMIPVNGGVLVAKDGPCRGTDVPGVAFIEVSGGLVRRIRAATLPG